MQQVSASYSFNPTRVEPAFTSPPPLPANATIDPETEKVKSISQYIIDDAVITRICQLIAALAPGQHWHSKKGELGISFFITMRKGFKYAFIPTNEILRRPKPPKESKVRAVVALIFTAGGFQRFLSCVSVRQKLIGQNITFAASRIDAAENLEDIKEILQPLGWGKYRGKRGDAKFSMVYPRMRGDYCDFAQVYDTPGKTHNFAMVAVQTMRAIAKMHEKGYIHRDVKPDNILLDWDEKQQIQSVKLSDLEMCCTIHPNDFRRRDVFGSFLYAPPEVLAMNRTFRWPEFLMKIGINDFNVNSFALDTYSLGKLLYRIYIGQFTREARLVEDIMDPAKRSDALKNLNAWRLEIELLDMRYIGKDGIQNFLERQIRPNPEMRPRDEELLPFAADLAAEFHIQ